MISRRHLLRQTALLAAAATTGGAAACTADKAPETPVPTPAPAIIRGHLGESIDELLTGMLPAGAALTTVAARDSELVYGKGFGMSDREAGIPAGVDTAYDIGSITKQFTASAILALETGGELATADPVARFVTMPSDKRGITLHHLLTHTSGLVEQLGDDYAPTSRDELLAAAAHSTLLWGPAAGYRYSNLGYSVLAAVIELVSGVGYETFLAEQLFTPAGMTDTGYVLPQWRPGQAAVEYDSHGAPHGRPFDQPWDADGPYWNLRGNGGILSTARDMFRWHLALHGSGVLSAGAKAKLFTPHVLEDNGETHYGYGWVLFDDGGHQVAWHNGGNGRSYAEYLRSDDQDLMYFWASNNAQRDGSWDLEELDLSSELYRHSRDEAGITATPG